MTNSFGVNYNYNTPQATIDRLNKLLNEMHIDIKEIWNEDIRNGIHSLRLVVEGTDTYVEGGGNSKERAKADAYIKLIKWLKSDILRKVKIENSSARD